MAPAALPAPNDERRKSSARQIGTWLGGLLVLTLLAGGTGAGLGIYLSETVEKVVNERIEAQAAATVSLPRYSGDVNLMRLEPVIANLAAPPDTWIRLETAMVYTNGSLESPNATAAEISEDILAYVRTLSLEQLQGPSALQHLREDLDERATLRSGGKVDELIIETMVLQ